MSFTEHRDKIHFVNMAIVDIVNIVIIVVVIQELVVMVVVVGC